MASLSANIEEQIDLALAEARDPFPYEVASSVSYLESDDLLLIVMKSGQRVAIPIEELQGLCNADRKMVADFELVGSGHAVHWEKLNVDFSVQGLAGGFYGSERWMRHLHEKRRANEAAALSQTA